MRAMLKAMFKTVISSDIHVNIMQKKKKYMETFDLTDIFL